MKTEKNVKVNMRKNGDLIFYLDDKIHRNENYGPAIIKSNGDLAYMKLGKLHRSSGPAIIKSNGYKAWYIDGCLIKEENYANALEFKPVLEFIDFTCGNDYRKVNELELKFVDFISEQYKQKEEMRNAR